MREHKSKFEMRASEAMAWNRTSVRTVVRASARAVRPASLAASARPEWFGTGSSLCAEPALSSEEKACLPRHSLLIEPSTPVAKVSLCKVTACPEQIQALRRSAKPKTRGRAGTSCCAARAGGVRLLAGGATQRTTHAGSELLRPLPNPSIERTNNGGSSLSAFASAQPPLFASHLKR